MRLRGVLIWIITRTYRFDFLQYLRFAMGNCISEFEKGAKCLIGALGEVGLNVEALAKNAVLVHHLDWFYLFPKINRLIAEVVEIGFERKRREK